MTLAPLNANNRARYRVPNEVKEGVLIIEVAPDSSAAEAGLRPGDVIREVNRQRVRSINDFEQAFKKAGQTVAILLQRGPNTIFVAIRKKQ